MSGFFPVMIFGLPAACLAMYHSARPERRAEVGGMLLSLALTAMLTGVTEPIEFTFMFLAPVLYGVHAVLTGVAMALMDALHIRLGFGFSAGLLDYVLNFGRATRPLLLFPIGAVYGLIYYGLFRFCIVRFDLPTPGREVEPVYAAPTAPVPGTRAQQFVEALGGRGNLATIDACTTRLRLIVRDQQRIDEVALKRLGARGVLRPSARDLQVIVGPTADQLAREMREAPVDDSPRSLATELLDALGGRSNIATVHVAASRVIVTVVRADAASVPKIDAAARGAVQTQPGRWQIVVGRGAENVIAAWSQTSADGAV